MEIRLYAKRQHGSHTLLRALVIQKQSRAAAGAVSLQQAGQTMSAALLGADRHYLACEGLLGATVPCHS